MVSVCVFCGASAGSRPELLNEAGRLGESLARAGFGLVYGAGGVGMMGALSDGALRAGGHVTGVIPQALMDREFGRTDLTDLRVVASMHERKALMYELSAAFVTLPGGLGTFEEFFETTTWSQLGLHAKPSLVLNVGGYYAPLDALLDHALKNGFITAEDRALVSVSDTVDELVAELGRLVSGD
jgi:uncharacterized protein (TIGR00730 family)